MPKQKQRRARTGCVRRKPIRQEQEQYRHSHSLNSHELSLRACFQIQMSASTHATNTLCRNISDLLYYSTMVHRGRGNNVILDSVNREVTLLRAMQEDTIQPLATNYFQSEASLCDVPDNLHDIDHDYGPPRNRTIDDFTDYQALHYTNFSKKQLKRIYRCFNFGNEPVRIHCSQNHYYSFQPQYLFLFGMVKISTGLDNLSLCDLLFGGSPRRMSNAFKTFCVHLYDRYYDPIVSYKGLEREVHNLPYYATKIARRFNQERFLIDNVTGEQIDLDGLIMNESQCKIAMLIDGSVTETLTPGTGPNGDYHGSMRRPHAYVTQRAVYSGYKKLHGLSCLELCLPNGIHYMYGPCSMRQSDSALVNMSGVDQYLQELQENLFNGRIYSAYGDKLFNTSVCITRAHVGDRLNPLTEQQELENRIMNALRITIEHAFAVLGNRWKLMSQYDEFKMNVEHPHAKELLVVAYLLSNICVTLQGSQVCGAGTFFCNPPSLEEYLELGDEDDDVLD